MVDTKLIIIISILKRRDTSITLHQKNTNINKSIMHPELANPMQNLRLIINNLLHNHLLLLLLELLS